MTGYPFLPATVPSGSRGDGTPLVRFPGVQIIQRDTPSEATGKGGWGAPGHGRGIRRLTRLRAFRARAWDPASAGLGMTALDNECRGTPRPTGR